MTEQSQETKIAILEAKVEHMMGHVKELTLRVRANEKVVAIVSAIGIGAGGIVGTTAFAPRADAVPSAGEWIQEMRNWKSEKERIPIDETLNSALIMHEEESHGCNDPTEQEELLQLPSGEDKQSGGWRYDRRDVGPGIQSDEEGKGQDCSCGHSREKDKESRREGVRD